MSSNFERRLKAVERRLNAKHPALSTTVVHGGLPPGEPLFAVAGEHEWLREPTEDLEAFCERVTLAAMAARELKVRIGGLPATEAQSEVAKAAYLQWLNSGYNDVPPTEAPGYTRPRSRLGWRN